jgi:arylsulfatase A
MATNVRYMDHVVGRMVRAIDEAGLRENTIILFTGITARAARARGTGQRGAQEPMIVRCPGTVKAGVVSDALVSLVDVFPTIAEFTNAPIPPGLVLDGRRLRSRRCAANHRSTANGCSASFATGG